MKLCINIAYCIVSAYFYMARANILSKIPQLYVFPHLTFLHATLFAVYIFADVSSVHATFAQLVHAVYLNSQHKFLIFPEQLSDC